MIRLSFVLTQKKQLAKQIHEFLRNKEKEMSKKSRLILAVLIFRKLFSSRNPSRALGIWVSKRPSWVLTWPPHE